MQVIALVKETAQGGLDAECAEVVARGQVSPNALRTTIRLQLHGRHAVSDEPCKGLIPLTEVFVVWK